jgi:hypothetical protein
MCFVLEAEGLTNISTELGKGKTFLSQQSKSAAGKAQLSG